ncbi:MAG TPA: hypothetical protein PK689_05445, partial [Kiritimatiellia bacterium]|nr:hypothetical protein [Kiritimatiellia bacterium]
LARAQAETTGASIRGLLDRGGAGAVAGVWGLLTQRSGKVRITKADGREVAFTDGILEKGDRLLVEEGHARVTMLDGRCVAVVGPGSEIALTEDNAEKQTMEQTGGKVEVEVERAEDFTERMTKSIARFWDDLGAIAGADRSDIEAALKFGRRRLEARFRAANKVTAVLGVRGTHYECEARRDGGLEVTVYEGVVDVTILETGQFLALASGEKGIVAPGGALRKENFPLPPAGERETEIPAL